MDAIKSQWADLPPNVRGILWVVLSGLLFASFMAIVRHVGTTMNPIQMSFIRYAFGMLFMLPFFMRMKKGSSCRISAPPTSSCTPHAASCTGWQ